MPAFLRMTPAQFAAALAMVLLTLCLSAAPANADEPYPPSGTFATTNAQLKESGCFYHRYTLAFDSGPMTEEWGISIRVLGPDGTLADIASRFGSNWSRGTLAEDILLCSSLDQPGTYTLTGFITTWPGDVDTVFPPLTFEVLPVPVADVTGTVAKRVMAGGAKLIFRSAPTPTGYAQGRRLTWKIAYDGRSKRIAQHAAERDVLRLAFRPGTGKHAIRVYRNGARVLKVIVRT